MAKLELTAKVTQRFWVKPFVYLAAYVFAIAGKSEFPEAFVDFIVHRGFKIEIEE